MALKFLIPVYNFEAQIILALFAFSNLLCQTRIFLLQLTRYVGFSQLMIVVAFAIPFICMILPGVVKSITKRFWSLLIYVIGLPFCISSIDAELL